MLVDPWSVSPELVDQLAAQLFAASLFPYLAFLYFLGRPQTAVPPLAKFGFQFLLVFVGATIPAGIYAKVAYGDILANIDWLHGGAESLLTITNLLIVLGFRNAIPGPAATPPAVVDGSGTKETNASGAVQRSPGVAGALALASGLATFAATAGLLSLHAEPGNALSFPTWVIHASSLVEWLAAMGLVWQFASITHNPRWKGLVWGMLPLHTSGLCACTYHLFYNAPALNALVALQAGLTCFGNATMALAAWRISRSGGGEASADEGEGGNAGGSGVPAAMESNGVYFAKVFALSAVVSALVKWGSLAVDWPMEPTWTAALALILGPTALNVLKWGVRSRTGNQTFGGLL